MDLGGGTARRASLADGPGDSRLFSPADARSRGARIQLFRSLAHLLLRAAPVPPGRRLAPGSPHVECCRDTRYLGGVTGTGHLPNTPRRLRGSPWSRAYGRQPLLAPFSFVGTK